MSKSRFSNIRVLIIDDLSEMRSSLKSMLDMLGTDKIDQAHDGENALEFLRNQNYGLVLCDYELGRGKDGQQILEEARHAHLLKESASFIMVTAAQTMEMVMGALEYQPDGYIAKPVTYDELQKRLLKILRRKAIFSEISDAIDKNEVEEAIENCNRLIVEKPKYALATYRIKGKVLYDVGRYEEAKELYETVLSIRPVAWANLGEAKCWYQLKQPEKAKPILEELIKTNDKFVECYDLLAEIHADAGKLKEAQKTLELATAQSSKAVLRQSRLSHFATKNEDWNVATKASRKAVSLGKNSVHENPDDFLNLARALQPQLINGGYRDKTYALNEIQRSLNTVRKKYNDQQIHVKASLLEGLTLKNQGKDAEAKKQLQFTRAIFDSLKVATAKKCVADVTKTYIETGDDEAAVNFLAEMKEKNMLDDSQDIIKEIKEEEKPKPVECTVEQRKEMDNLNNKGVELFEKGKLSEALKLFKKACNSPAAGASTYINTLQATIMYMQKEGYNDKEARLCIALFERLDSISKDEKNSTKINKLKKMFKTLK